MTEFAVLAILLFCAWHGSVQTVRRAVLLTAPCCLLVAFADEFHQAFVPNRGPSINDVFIDFLGAVLGILIVLFVIYLARRRVKRKE